jgi:pimeloyl-ACP methyl ester carboxylesterase
MSVRLGIVLVAAVLGSLGNRAAGWGRFHPVPSGTASVIQQCEQAPADGREHVHIYFINGADPLCLGNLNGLADRIRAMGFPNTHFRQCWQCRNLCREVAAIRQQDPDAKIMLIGFSYGAVRARQMAQTLAKERIWVDSLVYVAGDFIKNSPDSSPSNVGHVVNLQAHGYLFSGYDLFFNGEDIAKAQNQRVDTRHMSLPTRNETIDALSTELAGLAQKAHTALAARTTTAPAAVAGTPAATTVAQPASRTVVPAQP